MEGDPAWVEDQTWVVARACEVVPALVGVQAEEEKCSMIECQRLCSHCGSLMTPYVTSGENECLPQQD